MVVLDFIVPFSSVPLLLRSRCRLVQMHSFTFILLSVALFAVLSAAHPIVRLGHVHRITKVKARSEKSACKPPVVGNYSVPIPSPTPTPNINDEPNSDDEPPTVPIVPTLLVKPSSSRVDPTPTEPADPTPTESAPTPTEGDDEDSNPTQTPSTGGGSSLTGKLFPSGFGSDHWTTSEGIDGALPLSDATLKPTKVLTALSRDVVKAPDGKLGMKAHYPQGSYTFTHDPMGGFSFYAPGPSDVDLSTALEATFGYSVFFEEDFDYQLGGKLLGFCE